jgi:hypothetical protein
MRGLEPIVRAFVRWSVDRRGRLDLETLEAIWPLAVGRVWGERTRPKALRGPRLEVAVPDGVWLAELRFQRERILERLNDLLPEEAGRLESIRLTVGGAPAWAPTRPPSEAAEERVPLTVEQEEALDAIDDPELRAVVARVIERDTGRLGAVHDRS